MANLKYDKDITALLVIDPYNDFISEGGKIWDRIKDVAETNNCVPHMLEVLNAAHGIHKLVVIGLKANTCLQATVRFAAELGYEVTVVKDATASFSEEEMHAALDINIPNYAGAIVTTDEVVDSISSPSTSGTIAQQ